jgi:hypothetical protein
VNAAQPHQKIILAAIIVDRAELWRLDGDLVVALDYRSGRKLDLGFGLRRAVCAGIPPHGRGAAPDN